MANNKIILGDISTPIAVFESEKEIRNINYTSGVDVVGAELTIDVFTPVVDYPYDADSAQVIGGMDFDSIISSDGYIMCTNKTYVNLRETPYGTVIRYYRDGTLKVKAYVKNVERSGTDTYRINAISAIGLLDRQYHYGDLYTGQKFTDVLSDIISGAVNYTVDSEVANIAIYNWLPYDTSRANLHRLLFATGVTVGRNENGDMDFHFLTNDEVTAISENRIYIEGEADYSSPVSAVEVTEHSYMKTTSDETVVEYDNSDGSEIADNTFIAFQNAPLYRLMVNDEELDIQNLPQTINNMTVHAAGTNYAIISGTGILSGNKYTHSTHVLTMESENLEFSKDNVAKVTDCTLINALNSENVAQRVFSYYSSKRTVKSSIVLNDERPGDLIAAISSFYEPFSGFISTMDVTVSSIIKASCTVITDYIPTNGGNNFDSVELLTGTGTFTITSEALLVLIGGGQGGQSGAKGENGENSSSPPLRSGGGGAGGSSGNGGSGGKVFTVRLPAGIYRYDSGAGGIGGVSSNAAQGEGSDGGATELYDENGNLLYSSADGTAVQEGYANIITGEIYASHGSADGTSGGRGGKGNGGGGSYAAEGVTYEGQTWSGGATGKDKNDPVSYGGGGGGAAVGSDGGKGEDGTSGGRGASGGAGANANIARTASTILGRGGDGGHGGGGGGGGNNRYASEVGGGYATGSGGPGGLGGPGGDGGPGGIILYTKSRKEAA